MKTFKTMLKTELRLSIRGMDMPIFAIAFPAVMIIILGIIYSNQTDFAQSFSAVSCIAICAGGAMGLPLVISTYRSKKILKRFQVTPVSPIMILTVQLMVYAIYALCSLGLVYAIAALCFGFRLQGNWGVFLSCYFLVMTSMFSIGMMVGGISSNPKTASVIASLLYFPMLIFSGATLPYEMMPPVLQRISDIMPMTQGIKLLKSASLGLPLTTSWVSLFFILALTAVCVAITLRFFRWE